MTAQKYSPEQVANHAVAVAEIELADNWEMQSELRLREWTGHTPPQPDPKQPLLPLWDSPSSDYAEEPLTEPEVVDIHSAMPYYRELGCYLTWETILGHLRQDVESIERIRAAAGGAIWTEAERAVWFAAAATDDYGVCDRAPVMLRDYYEPQSSKDMTDAELSLALWAAEGIGWRAKSERGQQRVPVYEPGTFGWPGLVAELMAVGVPMRRIIAVDRNRARRNLLAPIESKSIEDVPVLQGRICRECRVWKYCPGCLDIDDEGQIVPATRVPHTCPWRTERVIVEGAQVDDNIKILEEF